MLANFARALANGGSPAGSMAVAADDALDLQPVAVISGALMLASRTLLDRIGGFDPGYRLHAEDLDLCRTQPAARPLIALAHRVPVVTLPRRALPPQPHDRAC